MIPDAELTDALGKLQTTKTAWRLMLWKNNYTPDGDTVFASLTEANYSGYARLTPTMGTIGIATHVASSDSDLNDFAHDGGGTANDIYGWALIDTTPGTPLVKVAKRLDGAPKTMAVASDHIRITLSELLREFTV